MREMVFAGGVLTLLDEQDFAYLSQWIWQPYKNANGRIYIARGQRIKRVSYKIYMHREIAEQMHLSLSGDIDHRDRNTLNNQRYNLRPAHRSENNMNSGLRSDNTSGYRGVSYYKARNKWTAELNVFSVKLSLGYFETPEEASAAYKKAAKMYYPKFAGDL